MSGVEESGAKRAAHVASAEDSDMHSVLLCDELNLMIVQI
jgi:hypothetical protein